MRKIKRFAALALLFALLISVLPSALADESDVYILYHDSADYNATKFHYFSPYSTDYTYDGTQSWIYNQVFTLYNSVTAESIPAYCVDVWVGVAQSSRYRQQNLEESTYAGDMADQLRATVINGFYLMAIPGETEAEHAVRAAAKLQELGAAAGVPDLTIGEAISATQGAIWEVAHGSLFEPLGFSRNYIYNSKNTTQTLWYNLCNEERINGHINADSNGKIPEDRKADIMARIAKVYDYLLTLDPIPPAEPMASPKSFLFAGAGTPVDNGDGTYDILVKTTVDVNMDADDSLTLIASVSDSASVSAPLHDGAQALSLTLENVPAEDAFEEVTLTIEGTQTAYDVFLFDAEGEREASQTMIGMNHSSMPVRTSTRAVPLTEEETVDERILHFYKTTKDDNRIPLEGISFDIYYAASIGDYTSGTVLLPKPENYVPTSAPVYTLVTDALGYASLNLTENGLDDGVYYVVEREHPAIAAPVDPFYVQIPMPKADGSGWEYEITIQPKNTVKGSVRIEKDVHKLGNNELSADAYANHTWIIGANIPEDISEGKSYVISDTLDSRLDYIGNMRVQVESVDGTQILAELLPGPDYTLKLTDVDSVADGTNDTFALELTRAGMQKAAAAVGANSFSDYMLRVYFDAQINANAEMNEEIPNRTTIEYTNSLGFDFSAESDVPVVYTGGTRLQKVDAEDNSIKLEGASFTLYRRATEQEVAAGEGLEMLDGFIEPMVKVYFFDNAELSGEKVCTATTDANGLLAAYGLAYGDYYWKETEAPGGYNLPKTAIMFNVNEASLEEGMIVIVENVQGNILPSTGGIGTTVFYAVGFAMMLAAVVLLVTKRRMSAE